MPNVKMVLSVLKEYGAGWAAARLLYSLKLRLLNAFPPAERLFEKTPDYPKRLDLFRIDTDALGAFLQNGLSEEDKVRHICQFVSGLWQIHPFREGNTRTTAVFTIQYLRSLGYVATNDMFKEHSWYFRNALVRANYKNARLGINYDSCFLERFFRNLLLNENNELKNRYMLINAPEGWKTTDDKPTITDDKSRSTDDKSTIILSYLKEKGSCKTAELSAYLGLKTTQTKAYLYQLLQEGKIVAHGANKNRTYTLA